MTGIQSTGLSRSFIHHYQYYTLPSSALLLVSLIERCKMQCTHSPNKERENVTAFKCFVRGQGRLLNNVSHCLLQGTCHRPESPSVPTSCSTWPEILNIVLRRPNRQGVGGARITALHQWRYILALTLCNAIPLAQNESYWSYMVVWP